MRAILQSRKAGTQRDGSVDHLPAVPNLPTKAGDTNQQTLSPSPGDHRQAVEIPHHTTIAPSPTTKPKTPGRSHIQFLDRNFRPGDPQPLPPSRQAPPTIPRSGVVRFAEQKPMDVKRSWLTWCAAAVPAHPASCAVWAGWHGADAVDFRRRCGLRRWASSFAMRADPHGVSAIPGPARTRLVGPPDSLSPIIGTDGVALAADDYPLATAARARAGFRRATVGIAQRGARCGAGSESRIPPFTIPRRGVWSTDEYLTLHRRASRWPRE